MVLSHVRLPVPTLPHARLGGCFDYSLWGAAVHRKSGCPLRQVLGAEAASFAQVDGDGVVFLVDGYVEGGLAVVGEGVDVRAVG